MTDIQGLFELIKRGTSSSHTAAFVREGLLTCGFSELSMKEDWELNRGGKYFIHYCGSTLIAFTLGKDYQRIRKTESGGLRGRDFKYLVGPSSLCGRPGGFKKQRCVCTEDGVCGF